jgi:DNA-directed RNA polymerase specialized sigma24 family protein
MTSDSLARDYLQRARTRRIAVEALLVEPPKRHDVQATVAEFIERFPAEWRQALGDLRQALDRLASDRAAAFYGAETEGIPASELFSEDDARRAMVTADRLLALYARLLDPDH